MRFLKLGLILIAVSLFIFACSQNSANNANVTGNTTVVTDSASNSNTNAATPAQNDELAEARQIYSQKCVKCHKEDGSGGESVIDGEKIKAPNFHSERKMNDKDADWIDTIENGAKEDGMPAFKGKLTDDQIKDLVKLIHRDIQKKQ